MHQDVDARDKRGHDGVPSITAESRAARLQSGVTPATATTFAHLVISSAMMAVKSAGEPASTLPPMAARRAANAGSASAALISRLSRLTTSAGVPLGTPMPVAALAS